ncbi:MAG: methyltransferase domain-containing protein [Minwuia sp.]|nr:methyltransferase domain-containing protein [Minwuia sp.]
MTRYVNIGCGHSVGAGWENYDASPTLRLERLPVLGKLVKKNKNRFPSEVMYGDITRGPIGAPNSVSAAFCSHMLEHVSQEDMRNSLKHIHMMLETGGVFRLIVPDLSVRARMYVGKLGQPDAASRFLEMCDLGQRGSRRGMKSRLYAMLGNSAHLWMYDEASMRQELELAGFVDIRPCAFGDNPDPAFAEVEDPDRFGTPDFREVAMECRKA